MSKIASSEFANTVWKDDSIILVVEIFIYWLVDNLSPHFINTVVKTFEKLIPNFWYTVIFATAKNCKAKSQQSASASK
jgi:hypothetical protein